MTILAILRCRQAGSGDAIAAPMLAGLLGLAILDHPAGSIVGQGTVGLGEEHEALQVRSEVKSLAIVSMREVPKAPPAASDRYGVTCR